MKLIDSHAHLHREYFPAAELEAVLGRARGAGIEAMISCATRLEDLDETVELAEREPDVWATAGIHPHDARQLAADPEGVVDRLRRLARHPRVVAIGECGLDYHYDHSPRDQQQLALRAQIRLAIEAGKPLILHNRASDADLLAILEQERAARAGGVVHAFSSEIATARQALDLGFHLGFTGMVTFKKADNVRQALAATPLDRLLVETDTPYLAPVPHRGKTNEPAFVRLVAERAAAELGVAPDELAARTTANARRLFGLDRH